MFRYSVFEKEQIVGEATLHKEGLYCRVHCEFSVEEPEQCHLICCGEEKTFDLGRGVPSGNRWEIQRFLPWYNLPEKEITFRLEKGLHINKLQGQKLVPGEPVEQISKVVTGKLYCCEDGYWVVDNANE